MKELMPTTRTILRQVEEKTGKGIQFIRDDQMTMLATLQIARNGADFHILRYQPSNDPIDYLVAFQAGFVLRLFDNPPNQRFDFAPKSDAPTKIETLLLKGKTLTGEDARRLPEAAGMITQWAFLNLRSLPIGMRIDQWIATAHPDLRDLQAKSIEFQQHQNATLLSTKIKGFEIPVSLMGPIAAYAMFADRLANNGTYAIPFEAIGLHEQGNTLLERWDSTPSDATHDRALVDAWAKACGLEGWYDWLDYTP
jgi:hypothetical protein